MSTTSCLLLLFAVITSVCVLASVRSSPCLYNGEQLPHHSHGRFLHHRYSHHHRELLALTRRRRRDIHRPRSTLWGDRYHWRPLWLHCDLRHSTTP
ncbi:hypothetical protein BD310DRAFT_930756 [Dichomitus squalens]|uniref:Secreted protein n=1 Tax=Dichomitus squalens TaxID=114155 RepID=A0A4Q9PQY5_9APHY|nr:hypothetical protein BD310DRAFT_930756 [Dichomitus squalens]